MAAAAALGLDGWRAVDTGDPVEAMLLAAATERAQTLQEHRDRAFAVTLVNTLAKSLDS